MKRKDQIKTQRILIKITVYSLTVLLSPFILIGFAVTYLTQRWLEWKDTQYQRIEYLRIDLVYLRDKGKTYKEYYNDEIVEDQEKNV